MPQINLFQHIYLFGKNGLYKRKIYSMSLFKAISTAIFASACFQCYYDGYIFKYALCPLAINYFGAVGFYKEITLPI